MGKIQETEKEKLLALEQRIHKRIINQEEDKKQVKYLNTVKNRFSDSIMNLGIESFQRAVEIREDRRGVKTLLNGQ